MSTKTHKLDCLIIFVYGYMIGDGEHWMYK